jgi:hypothetical protein
MALRRLRRWRFTGAEVLPLVARRAGMFKVAVSVTAILVASTPQVGARPGCITRAEYRQVEEGMRARKVHAIFDTSGKQVRAALGGGLLWERRRYRACNSERVLLEFENKVLTEKEWKS